MIFRIIRYIFLCLAWLFVIAMAILLTPPLFRRFVTYPSTEKEINNFQKQRKEPRSLTGLNLYRGVMHVHTAGSIVENSGLFFYSNGKEYNLGNKWVQGMEIYNFHTDAKDKILLPHFANFIVNGRKYPQLSYHEMFDEQTATLSVWDSLNREKKIVGFSAVDAHENLNFRARYTEEGRIQWVGPNANIIGTTAVRSWNRWLLHSPDKSGWIFKLMTDTYSEGFNFVTNYVFANSLSVSSLSEHIKKGHLFSAFTSLGDAGGFMFYGTGQNDSICCIMGDSIEFDKVSALNAVTPLPGQFRLLHNGKTVNTSSYDTYDYNWGDMIEKGAYRIEVHIQIKGSDMPWIYSNPIYIY